MTVTVDDGGEREVGGSHLLAALGRTPNTDDLGLEHAGIEVDDKGFIEVDVPPSVRLVRLVRECITYCAGNRLSRGNPTYAF